MTDLTPHDRLPGSRLLKIARVIFDESVLKTVVQPTIADLQRELLDASASSRTRLVARMRGYRAFWTLVLVAPFAFWQSPAPSRPGALAFPDIAGRVAVTLILLTLITLNGSVLGIWTLAVGSTSAGLLGLPVLRWFLLVSIPLGVLFGWALLAWHASHPLRGLPENRIVLR